MAKGEAMATGQAIVTEEAMVTGEEIYMYGVFSQRLMVVMNVALPLSLAI